MIFKPSIVARMWDTWLYYHEGKHYLFYLHNSRADVRWDGMSVAVSDDGVHFDDHGPIIHKADDAVWLGTGMVWRVGDKFMLNFSEERAGIQEIFFAESDDLLNWTRLPDEEYICQADSRWYHDDPTFTRPRWDCIWALPREDGEGYIGFLTAVARHGPAGLCGTAGCVVSDDGRHFRAAPPVIETGVWGDRVEVGAVEKFGGRHYMLLGVGAAPLGARQRSRLPAGEGGMFVLNSENQAGPYELDPQQAPFLSSSPILYTYFARFYRYGDELLLNHHTVPRSGHAGPEDIYFSPLKSVQRDDAGILSLHWWNGNEALKGKAMPVVLGDSQLYGLQEDACTLAGGQARLSADTGGLAVMPVQYNTASGVILEAEVTPHNSDAALSGVGVFVEGEVANLGTLLLAQSNGQVGVGRYDGYSFRPQDAKPHSYSADRPARWRLLVRDAHVELYIDDVHIQCYTMDHGSGGRLGFAVEAGSATISNVQAWEMSL